MHTKILDVKDTGVTLGVLDKGLELVPELRQVTFQDIFGAIHAVQVHREGPFQAVADILAAHDAGMLHPYESHDAAVEQLRLRDDHVTAARVEALAAQNPPRTDDQGEGE